MNAFAALAIGGAEVTASGYARRPTTLAYAADGVTLCNLASIQWPVATASWGVIDTVLLYDAVTGGALSATFPAVTPIEIRMYDIARIPAAGIELVVGVTTVSVPVPGVFGPFGLGAPDGTPGAFSPLGYDIPTGVPGAFGPAGYGALVVVAGVIGVPLERAFDRVHVCSPGVWAKAA